MYVGGARETVFDLCAHGKGEDTRLASLRVLRAAPRSNLADAPVRYELILANYQLGMISSGGHEDCSAVVVPVLASARAT